MEKTDQIDQAKAAELQKSWESDFHHLFMLVRGKFRVGTLVTITARIPGEDPESDFCWTMEQGTEELRHFLDRLDERNKKREVVAPNTQIIKPEGFKVFNGTGNGK